MFRVWTSPPLDVHFLEENILWLSILVITWRSTPAGVAAISLRMPSVPKLHGTSYETLLNEHCYKLLYLWYVWQTFHIKCTCSSSRQLPFKRVLLFWNTLYISGINIFISLFEITLKLIYNSHSQEVIHTLAFRVPCNYDTLSEALTRYTQLLFFVQP